MNEKEGRTSWTYLRKHNLHSIFYAHTYACKLWVESRDGSERVAATEKGEELSKSSSVFFLHSVSRPTPDANIFTYTWKEGLTVMNSYSHIVTTTAWYIGGANVSYFLAAFSHSLVQLKNKCNRHFLALQAFSFYVVLFCLWIFFVLKSKKTKTSTLMT